MSEKGTDNCSKSWPSVVLWTRLSRSAPSVSLEPGIMWRATTLLTLSLAAEKNVWMGGPKGSWNWAFSGEK